MSEAVHQLLTQHKVDSFQKKGDFPVDEGVLDALPAGSTVASATRYGTSAWTITAKLEVEHPEGPSTQYFLKCASQEAGRRLIEGEFNAMSVLNEAMPKFIPKPYATGRYRIEDPVTYFNLFEYIDMSDKMPDPAQLCSKLAELHRTTTSRNGMFGFHVNTCQGRIEQSLGWEKTWTALFTKNLQHVMDRDLEANGSWPALEHLESRLASRIIPRLVGNLERDGRSIKPCLIHGDLWEGNTGTSYETGDVYVFDAASYYAHSEMEIANWRCDYNKIHNKVYTRTYLRHFTPSEPREEWEDRNRLYCIYYNVIYSVNHLNQGTAVRQTAYDDMYFLIDKYAPFDEGEGPPRIEASERAALSEERDHTTHEGLNYIK